jgi:D-xylose transport system permease protein
MTSAITQVHLNFAQWGWLGAMLSVLSALSVGSFCGGMTGLFVSRLNVTPFIVTLGMMVIGRGLTLIISGAQAVAPLGPELGRLSSDYLPVSLSWGLFTVLIVGTTAYFIKNVFSYGENVFKAAKEVAGILFLSFLGVYVFCGYQGIPYMVIVAFICAILGVLTLKYLRFGRFLYAIGGNREAAELSGVPVKKTLLTVYFIMGLLAGLAGLLDSARVNGAVPSAGELTELDAIAAVVIGGTSLMGGAGTITGTVFGVLVLGMLNNGMSLMGMSEHYQKVFKGVVIILAVLLDMRSKKK